MLSELQKGQVWGTPDYPGFRYRIDEVLKDSSIRLTVSHNYEEIDWFETTLSMPRWLELMARGVLVKQPPPRIKLNPVGWRIRDWRQDAEMATPSVNYDQTLTLECTIPMGAIPNPDELLEQQVREICGTLGVPERVLLGELELYGQSPVTPDKVDPGSASGSWNAAYPFTSTMNGPTAAEIIEMSKTLREFGQSAREAKQIMDVYIASCYQPPTSLFDVPMTTKPPIDTGELFNSLIDLPVLNPRLNIKGTSE